MTNTTTHNDPGGESMTDTTLPIAQRRYKVALWPPSGTTTIDHNQTADEVADVLERFGHLVTIGAIARGETLEIRRTT